MVIVKGNKIPNTSTASTTCTCTFLTETPPPAKADAEEISGKGLSPVPPPPNNCSFHCSSPWGGSCQFGYPQGDGWGLPGEMGMNALALKPSLQNTSGIIVGLLAKLLANRTNPTTQLLLQDQCSSLKRVNTLMSLTARALRTMNAASELTCSAKNTWHTQK